MASADSNLQSQDLIGAIKIKDGLFIGDQMAAQDLEFVWANKVTHIINCAGRQVPNHWQPIGVFYQTYYWLDQDNQIPMDVAKNSVISKFKKTITRNAGFFYSSTLDLLISTGEIRNTFLNAQMGPLANYANIRFTVQDYDQKIRWVDLASGYAAGSAIGKKKLAVFNSQKDLINKKKVQPVNIHRKLGSQSLRPAIKGSRQKEIKRSITPPPKKTTISSQHHQQAQQRIGSARASKNRTQEPQVFYNNFMNQEKTSSNYVAGSLSSSLAGNNPISAAPASGSSLYANLPKSQASTQSIAKPGNTFQKYEPVLSRPATKSEQETTSQVKNGPNYVPLQSRQQQQPQQLLRQNSARERLQKQSNYDYTYNKQITSSSSGYTPFSQHQGSLSSSSSKHPGNSDSLNQIRKLQQSLSQVLKINPNQQQQLSTTAPTNVSTSGVTNIINNNNINNFYFPNNAKVPQISAYQATPTISAVTHQPRSNLSRPQPQQSYQNNKQNTISSSKTITKSVRPKRPSTAGPPPPAQDRANDLINDDIVSGLKTNYGKKRGNDSDRNIPTTTSGSASITRSSYDRVKFSNNSDPMRSSLKTQGGGNLITDANKKKRENSLRKSADPSISQSSYLNSNSMRSKGGSISGSTNLTASSFTAANPIPSSMKQTRSNQGYLSDRSIGSARGATSATSAASQTAHQNQGTIALNIGSNTYRGGGGGGNSKESGYPHQTASSMSGYNPSISTNNISSSSQRPPSHNYNPSGGITSQQQQYIQYGMNSFRSGPVKATTEVVDFSRYAAPSTSSSSSNQMRSIRPTSSSTSASATTTTTATAQNNDLAKRQKTFAQNRPPSPGAKGTSDQPYNIYANPNKDKKIVQTAKNKYRMRSISPGQQNQPQNLSASATSNMYQMRGYSPSKPRWKF